MLLVYLNLMLLGAKKHKYVIVANKIIVSLCNNTIHDSLWYNAPFTPIFTSLRS